MIVPPAQIVVVLVAVTVWSVGRGLIATATAADCALVQPGPAVDVVTVELPVEVVASAIT